MKPRILVPFDFSDSAENALAWATDLHETTGGDPIQLIHVISSWAPGMPRVPLDFVVPSEEEIVDLEGKMTAVAAKYRASVVGRVIVRPIPIGDVVLDAAREARANLIVMGTHGHTGIKRLVLGSVAEHVVRHADCPVVTVRRRAT